MPNLIDITGCNLKKTIIKDITNHRSGKLTAIKLNHTENGCAYWLCKCDCGRECIKRGNSISRKQVKSCGECNIHQSNFDYLYKRYVKSAKKRCIGFLLTKKQFKKLTSSNCYYCNDKPRRIFIKRASSKNVPYIYNGIDRVDNNDVYRTKNSVPCCYRCNQMKRKSTKHEFLLMIKEIYENLQLNKNE